MLGDLSEEYNRPRIKLYTQEFYVKENLLEAVFKRLVDEQFDLERLMK